MSKRAREEFGSNIDEPLAKDIKIDESAKDSAEEVSLEVYDDSLETSAIKPDAPSYQNSSAPATAADDNASLQSFLADLLFGKIGKGWHPLDFATWAKNQSAQDYFINQGYCTQEERSALSIHNAVIYGDVKRVTDFLRLDPSSIQSINDFGHNPLTAAITMNNKAMVNCLLDKGADIESVAGENKLTPLATAISIDDIGMVTLLLDRGADIDGYVSPNSECIPLLMALGFRHIDWGFDNEVLAAAPNIEIAKLLIERDADVDEPRGFHTAVAQASCRNLPEIIEILLQKGASFLQIEDHNIVQLAWEFKAPDSMQWFMGRLQKPADQYDEDTMHLALQVLEACMKDQDMLPISFLYEALSHDTDDKLMLREFEKHNNNTLLEDALFPYRINDESRSKDAATNAIAAVLTFYGTNDILLHKPDIECVIKLLNFLQTNVIFAPSCSIIINDFVELQLLNTSFGYSDRSSLIKTIKQFTDGIKDFKEQYNNGREDFEKIIDTANRKIHKMIEDNIKNGQRLISYFNDMKFTDAPEDNMRDPGWIICEYLGANVQRIMEANKSNLLPLNPSFIESGSEPSAAVCSSSYAVTSTGESEDTSMDG